MSVGSEIGRIPLNPQRPSRARSTENRSRVKYVVPLLTKILWFSVTRGPWWKIRKFKSIISRGPRLKIRKLHSIISRIPGWKIRKVKSTKGITYFTRLRFSVLRAREGRCGFRGPISSRFPSPHLLVGSDGFVPMSIVPTVRERLHLFKYYSSL